MNPHPLAHPYVAPKRVEKQLRFCEDRATNTDDAQLQCNTATALRAPGHFMLIQSLESIAEALAEAKVRYLIAGGLAVSAHGYSRATHDIDLVIQLDPANLERGLQALAGLGYAPVPPVPMMAFVDAEVRSGWIRDKGLTVFPLASPTHPQAPIDVFAEEPFDFNREYELALRAELVASLSAPVRFVSLDTLIAMKESAGRHKDLDDVQHLRWIRAAQAAPGPQADVTEDFGL